MSAIGNTFSGLPKWAQGTIAVVAVGSALFVGWKIYKKIQEAEALKNSDKTAKASKDEYMRLVRSGQKLTHPEVVYQTATNSIVNDLSGCELPSSEKAVIATIKSVVKKPIDWYYLVMRFGSQMVDDCGWGTGDTAYALPELLKDQLGQGDYVGIPTGGNYDDLQKYLKTIGITI